MLTTNDDNSTSPLLEPEGSSPYPKHLNLRNREAHAELRLPRQIHRHSSEPHRGRQVVSAAVLFRVMDEDSLEAWTNWNKKLYSSAVPTDCLLSGSDSISANDLGCTDAHVMLFWFA